MNLSETLRNWKQKHEAHGPDVTTHDLIKAIAVVIMIIDHVGYFFFPDQEWWRAIGRIGFPVWFFLAGYTRGGSISWELVAPMLLLVGVDAMTGYALLPINALMTIFLIRALLIFIPADYYLREEANLVYVLATLAIAVVMEPLSKGFFEYGTVGIMFGYLGYIVRNTPDSLPRRLLAVLCYCAFIFSQYRGFRMQNWELGATVFMTVGTAAFCFWLYRFRTGTVRHQEILQKAGPVIRGLGRHTLLIYTAHITILSFLSRLPALAPAP